MKIAYEKLKDVCLNSSNQDHKKYYEAFLSTDETIIKSLISQIYVIDSASDIVDVEKDIRKEIRYTCLPKYENQIIERLEGWWYQKAIEALCSDSPIFITQSQVRSYIVSVGQEYADDNLPIDIFDIGSLNENDFSENERVFYEQLKLICLGNRRMQIALRDYYRAFKQRANWVRNDLLYIDELEKYEERLIDEWEHAFAAMEDNLAEYSGVTEEEYCPCSFSISYSFVCKGELQVQSTVRSTSQICWDFSYLRRKLPTRFLSGMSQRSSRSLYCLTQ